MIIDKEGKEGIGREKRVGSYFRLDRRAAAAGLQLCQFAARERDTAVTDG
jgi:hypothetical protein